MRLALLLVALAATPAAAYHPLRDYAASANTGGGARMYFTGSPRWRGYDCTICHVDAPGLMRFEVTSEPAELLTSGAWTPGKEYTLTLRMVGETRHSESEHNTFLLGVEDDRGQPAGTFSDPGGDLQPAPGGGHGGVASDGVVAGKAGKFDVWTFRYTAPVAGTGRLSMYLGGVDGDGSLTAPAPRPETDPLGDDLYLGRWRLCEAGVPCDRGFPKPEHVGGDDDVRPACSAAPRGAAGAALLVLVALLVLRRRSLAVLAVLLVACADPTLPEECPGRICGEIGGSSSGDTMSMGGFQKLHLCNCDACKDQEQCDNHCKDLPAGATGVCFVGMPPKCFYGPGSCP